MTLAIPSSLSIASSGAANSSPNPTPSQSAPQVAENGDATADTVTLTEAQRVYELYNLGQTVTQIATVLNLPVESVNNYLGISSATS